MKKLFVILLFVGSIPVALRAQLHLELLAHVPNDSGITLAGCWHHVDDQDNEYALVGTRAGMDIYDLTIPTTPVRRFQVPGLINNWREIKTWGGFAYVGSEAVGSGITIVDLRSLPDTIYSKVWYGDGVLDGFIQRSHTVGAANGYLYVYGSTSPHNGAIICDLTDPWNPKYVGEYNLNYLHDGYVRGDTLWGSEIYSGLFSVIDISDKTAPVLLATQPTPGLFNHNAELSKNGKYLFTTDEKTFAPLAAFEVSDLSNITQTDVYYPSQRPSGEVHNVRVFGDDYLICPSYSGQLTIVDASDPHNLIETAWAIVGNSLVWDANPYLPSGVVFATAKAEGLFIFKPTYTRAGRLTGVVTDAVTGLPLLNAKVFVENTANADTTNLAGNYATGAPVSGTYMIRVERTGYITKTVGQNLQTGVNSVLNIALQPQNTAVITPEASKITVYPTLVQHTFWVNVPATDLSKNYTINLVDMNGKLLKSQPVTAEITAIAAPDTPGVYQVSVGGTVAKIVVKGE